MSYARPLQADLDALLAAHVLAPAENIRVVELGRTEAVSHHLAQVRHGEAPHVHRRHDLTVVMLRGTGILTVGDRKIAIASGDAMFIPRGALHFVTNAGSEPAVALVVFTPAFDGVDTVPAGDENPTEQPTTAR